jgi:nucleoside-diphosphate-sugar epimerase
MRESPLKIDLWVRDSSKAAELFGRPPGLTIWNELPSDVPADLIFHCASNATPALNSVDITGVIDTNVIMLRELLDYARRYKSRLMFISAGEVYGNATKVKIAEEDYAGIDPLVPRSNYGLSKLMGENLCSSYAKLYGMNVHIARLFHTYGPCMGETDSRICAYLVRQVVKRETIELNSDGSAVRAFCYIADVLSGLFTILCYGESGKAYNVGSDIPERIIDLADYLKVVYKVNISIPKRPVVTPYPRLVPDTHALRDLGWGPTVGITDGFDRTIRYYKGDENEAVSYCFP